MSEKSPRVVISLSADVEPMIDRIRDHLQDNLPEHLKSLRVSKSLAVETAIKEYLSKEQV